MKRAIGLIFAIFFLIHVLPAQNQVQIKVDATTTTGKLDPFWASQIIHPTEFLPTEWGKQFLKLLTENGAARQYIRIYNQPEAAIRVSPGGRISYDWNKFDEMAAMILPTGNKLKVVFFGMPYELARYPGSVKKRPFGAEVCISPPKDYKQWEELCADFTRHVIKKYGISEVSQWTFRCWNEPDHKGFWHDADLTEYLRLYDHFAKAVKEVSTKIRIGGPALTSTNTYKNPQNFKLFLDHIVNGTNSATQKRGAPLDFISVHTYGGSGAGGGPGRQYPEVDYLIEQQIRYADMRDRHPSLKNVPIHVEEWGESSGGTTGVSSNYMAEIRNSQYGAAFLAAWVSKHIAIRQENDRKIEGFTFCSSGYEGIRTHDFMGYRTLDTRHGFHKPVLNTYKLLNKLSSDLVPVSLKNANGHVSAFATADPKKVMVMITNYQSDQIHNAGTSYEVTLTVETPWKPGTGLKLKHWRIDKNHSNAFSAFNEIGAPQYPTPPEVDAIKARMHLELYGNPVSTSVEKLKTLTFELPCNSISLIEIEQ